MRTARYQSYLLRIWVEHGDEQQVMAWRFCLEETQTGRRRGFTSLVELFVTMEQDLVSAMADCSPLPSATEE